ncbi:MAG TPA: ABC transporter ATP-binding protein [Desulfobacteraceae bacterium]|nr:ABC transporter ATP-binding protein [Deltaproteobacteria bacterium]HDI61168.1 ABC transporter ATP-binding protein [Desulfobacteraceae bacterium]
MSTGPVLDIRELTTRFDTRRGPVTAVDRFSLNLAAGETMGLVGESGCGKSVTALSVMRLLPRPAGRIVGGQILFKGKDLAALPESQMRRIRGNEISMIFQEPLTSLNPVYTVGFQIVEAVRRHRRMDRRAAREEAVRMLSLVGMPEPAARMEDYPHQLSGGMQQRVMIAMALSCRPAVMIADEPTTALDVTIQAQILDLMNRLKAEIGMAVMLITHDLGVVAETCQRVAVMYTGRIVEAADVRTLFRRPAHPYTVGLFQSLPQIGGRRGRLRPIPGAVPSLLRLPPGCAFQERCFRSDAQCRQDPPWTSVGAEHWVRCWHPMEA